MTPQQYDQVREAFICLRDMDEEARMQQLAELDESVRTEVAALIESEQECGTFLEANSLRPDDRTTVAPEMMASVRDDELKTVGPYRLLQKIGEGGFGSVYMAEQSQPIQRRVAIKLIKPGMDSKQVLARFQAERQALAMMDHPSIARVFDAGTTEFGAPYFVMELVRGVPIDAFCDENQTPLEQRLQIFRQVCDAVHHAHRKGIIHRDLKPSNVLVGMGESEPVAKVIDFGIAKALDARLTEATLFTEFGQMVGTLEYMSPEQAEMSTIDVDTRSDIYSLGVLLYRLLTGTTPINKEQLLTKGLLEISRQLRQVDPPTPSERITSRQKQRSGSDRTCDPFGVSELPRGDLDWITMKCLSKDRRQRYDSARDLSVDIGSYLSGGSVTAHPPTLRYRIGKLVARNRALALVASALVAGVLLSIAGLTVGLRQAQKSSREAQRVARMLSENTYSQLVESAWRATQENDAIRAKELLEKCLPRMRGWEWHFVRSELEHPRTDVVRSSGPAILRIATVGSNQLYACVAEDGTVEVRDFSSDALVKQLSGDYRATAVAFSRDGRRLLVGTGEGSLLGFATGNWSSTSTQFMGKGGIYDIEFDDDGNALAVCTGAGWVRLLDCDSLELIREWQVGTRLSQIVFDDKTVIGAGYDGHLYQMQVDEDEIEKRFVSRTGLQAISRLLDGRVCVLTSGAALKLNWNSPGGTPPQIAQANSVATALATTPEGEILVGSGDGSVLVTGPTEPNQTRRKFSAAVRAAAWDPVNSCFLVALANGRIHRLQRHPGGRLQGEVATIEGALLLSRSSTAAILDTNGRLLMTDFATGNELSSVDAHTPAGWALSSDASERLLATVGEDRTVRCWELPTLELKFKADIDWGVRDACISPGGNWIAAAPPAGSNAGEGTVGIWDTKTSKCKRLLRGHKNWVLAIDVSPNGQWLVTAGENRTTRIWNTKTWSVEHVIAPKEQSAVEHIVVTNEQAILGHRDGWVTCWDIVDGKLVGEWAAFGDALSGLERSDDGRVLATSRSDSRLKIHDFKTGTTLAELDLGLGFLRGFALSRDSRYFSVAGENENTPVRYVASD